MKIDYSKIFPLFSEENIDKQSQHTSYDDIRNHPVYYLGMYKKLMNYKPLSGDKITQYLKTQRIDLNPDDVSRAGRYITYNKAWDYIKNFDVTNDFHIENLIEYSNDELIISFNQGIKHFELTTEYERCAFLKKILDSIPILKSK